MRLKRTDGVLRHCIVFVSCSCGVLAVNLYFYRMAFGCCGAVGLLRYYCDSVPKSKVYGRNRSIHNVSCDDQYFPSLSEGPGLVWTVADAIRLASLLATSVSCVDAPVLADGRPILPTPQQ
jgi:hypothetical protein